MINSLAENLHITNPLRRKISMSGIAFISLGLLFLVFIYFNLSGIFPASHIPQEKTLTFSIRKFYPSLDPAKVDTEKDSTYQIEQLKVSSKEVALVLIDVWPAHPNEGLMARMDENVKTTLKPMLDVARANGILVVFAPSGREIHPLVKPLSNEIVIDKKMTSYEIASMLQKKGITTLLYSGYASNICIITKPAAMAAMKRMGFNTILIRDASVATEDSDTLKGELTHRGIINFIEQNFGPTTTSKDVIDALNGKVTQVSASSQDTHPIAVEPIKESEGKLISSDEENPSASTSSLKIRNFLEAATDGIDSDADNGHVSKFVSVENNAIALLVIGARDNYANDGFQLRVNENIKGYLLPLVDGMRKKNLPIAFVTNGNPINSLIKPIPGEFMINNGTDAFVFKSNLEKMGIQWILVAGYPSNTEGLNGDLGYWNLSKTKDMGEAKPVFVRDASIAFEPPEFLDAQLVHMATVKFIEDNLGFTTTVQDVLNAIH